MTPRACQLLCHARQVPSVESARVRELRPSSEPGHPALGRVHRPSAKLFCELHLFKGSERAA